METPSTMTLKFSSFGKKEGDPNDCKKWQGQFYRMKLKLDGLYEDLKRDMYSITLPNPANIGELSSASEKIINGDGVNKKDIIYIRDCFLRDGIISHPSDFRKNVMYIYEVRNTLLNVRSGIYRSTTKFANNFFIFVISKDCLYTDTTQESIAEFFESLKILSLRDGVLPYFGVFQPTPSENGGDSFPIDVRICDGESEIESEYFTDEFTRKTRNIVFSISDLCKVLFGRHNKTWLDRIVESNDEMDENPSPKNTQDKRKAELARSSFITKLKTITFVSVSPPENNLLEPLQNDLDILEAFDLKFNYWTVNTYRRTLIVNKERELGEKGYRRISYLDGYSQCILRSFFSGNDKSTFPEVFQIDDR